MKVISGYLGRDLLIEGDIHSKETIRIDGQHRGTLISQQEVTLGVSAEVEGEIHASKQTIRNLRFFLVK